MGNAGLIVRMLVHNVVAVAGRAALLLIPAGTLAWPAAWIFLAEEAIGGTAIGLWLVRTDPDLLNERLSPVVQTRQGPFDRILLLGVTVAGMAWLVAMGFDAARDREAPLPLAFRVAGGLGLVASRLIRC